MHKTAICVVISKRVRIYIPHLELQNLDHQNTNEDKSMIVKSKA